MNRSSLVALTLANALALCAAAGAATLYARWLDAPQLATWAIALALARAGLLLLDGGLKTALVRRSQLPDVAAMRSLRRWCRWAALALCAALVSVVAAGWHGGRLAAGDAVLLVAYPAAYLLTYWPLLGALVRLERAGRFGAVAGAEAASVGVEFVLPVLLMAGGTRHWLAFALAAFVARILRSAWIVHAARRLARPPAGAAVPAASLLREGLGVQAVAALAMLRDQSHLWLLAPWFGAKWAAAYTLALMACTLVGQASAQAAARVALPLFRDTPADQQWPRVLQQTRWLASCALPPLALLPAWLTVVDASWWGGRWPEAAAIAGWLAVRMVAGVATTTLGTWLMATQSPWRSARAHAAWTACELAAASAALALVGPLGMAMAGAVTPWLGVWFFSAAAAPDAPRRRRFNELAVVLLGRPSLWIALGLAACVHVEPGFLLAASACLPLAWLSEPSLRQWLTQTAAARPLPQP